jgi:general secretion pathway protein N
MKPGRTFSLLTGTALLGAIASFNEMAPDAQASLLFASAKTARTTAESLLHGAVETYNEMTAPQLAGPPPAASQSQSQSQSQVAALPPLRAAEEGKEGDGAPPWQIAALTARGGESESPSGNPLSTLPLKQLSMTRDRPIFSPSRRPPPPKQTLVAPVAFRQPVKSAEPERPTISLQGTIIGSKADDQIGIFIDSATQGVIRLRVGEDHEGWVLRVVKARQATLVKDGELAVVLDLPAPNEGGMSGSGSMPSGGMPGIPQGGIVGMPVVARGAVGQNQAVVTNPAQQRAQQLQQQIQRQQR